MVAAKEKESTIEFFTPMLGLDVAPYLKSGDICGVHHLARYHWATGVLSQLGPKRILDIACGAGYGAGMIAKACPHAEVVGADYDERAIIYARQHEEVLPNLSFSHGNMVTWQAGTE